ncbi:hypothetical protein DXA59_05000 [Clostridium sp. OF03-18AA]|nr:hypothetical protein DXA59_05000 [Clostridium sp. OF03-18AA]
MVISSSKIPTISMMSEIPGITFHLNMVFLGAFPKQFPKSNKAGIPAVPDSYPARTALNTSFVT